MNRDQELQVQIKDGKLVIEIGIATLAFASVSENGGPIKRAVVADPDEWAKDVMYAMEDEGTQEESRLQAFLDKMIRAAEGNGSLALAF